MDSNGTGTPDRFIVDNLFTPNRLHLIFGPVRSGKSTLQLQIEWDWCNGREVFGNKSYPAHFCHVDALRPLSAIHKHMRHIGVDPALIPTISLLEAVSNEERTIDAVFSHAQRLVPSCRVIFLDGIQSLCHGNITYQRDVVNFMAATAKTCISKRITLIATAGTSKASESPTTSTPVMQRMTGSTSWAELAGALIHLGPTKPDQFTDPERTISISAPEYRPQELLYTFNEHGILEYVGDGASVVKLDEWLLQIATGSDVTSKDIVEAAEARGYKRSTAYTWLKQQIALGTLVLVARGMYRKPDPPSPN